MAGVTQTNSSNSAAADGITTVFSFTFFVYSTDHVKVYSVLNDVLSPITTGFTAAINSSFIGGTVTFSTPPAAALGDILVRREVPYTQATEFADITRYKETAIEEALNLLCLEIQQIQADVARAIKYTETAGTTDNTLGTPIDGSLLSFDGITGKIKSTLLASLSLTGLDTLFTSLASGDFLKFNGTNWINRTTALVASDLGVALRALLAGAQTFSGGQRCSITALTSSSAHIAVNLALNNGFSHTLTENTTLDNPTNIVAGQSGYIFITQAASAKSLAYGSYWDFPNNTTPSVSTGSGAVDTLFYVVRSATSIQANLVKGFA
jgi:hypothetical protein